MRTVTKKPSWKHVTFNTPKIAFKEWANKGIKIKISKDEFVGIGSTERELRDYFNKKFPKSIDPDGIKKHEAMKRYFKNKK